MDLFDAHVLIDDAVAIADLRIQDGVLAGEGNVLGNVTNRGGVVSPGSSYGMLTITGDYVQGPDGVLHIELDASSLPEPGINYDQLVIIGGTGIFEDGTTVRVRPTFGARLPRRAEYILVAGDVFFNPDAVQLDLTLPRSLFFDGWLEEGSMKLVLAVTPFDVVAETPNQKAVSEALTEAKDDPDTDLDDFFDWLVGLEPEDMDVARTAYDSLSGEVYTHLPTLAAQRLSVTAGTVVQGLYPSTPETFRRIWAVPYSDSGNVVAGPSTAGSHFQLSGMIAGADLLTTPQSRFGILAGAGRERLTMEVRSSDVQGEDHQAGLYGVLDLGTTQLTTLVGYNRTTYQGKRALVFGDVQGEVTAQFTTTNWAALAEARFVVSDSNGVRLEPVASLGYFHIRRPGFTEQGAGTLGLVVDGQELGWWQGRVALELASDARRLESGTVRPRASVAWVHSFALVERMVTGRLQGALEYPFTIYGTEAQRSAFESHLGLQGEVGESAVWSVDYTGTFRRDMSSHSLMTRVEFQF